MSSPEPFTVKAPLAKVASPARPTAPMSCDTHGAGKPPGAMFTVSETGALSAVRPALSVARAVNVKLPAGTPFQAKANGAVVSSPSFVAPAKSSTLAMVPSGSLALISTAMFAGAVKVAPLDGAVIATVGGCGTGGSVCRAKLSKVAVASAPDCAEQTARPAWTVAFIATVV